MMHNFSHWTFLWEEKKILIWFWFDIMYLNLCFVLVFFPHPYSLFCPHSCEFTLVPFHLCTFPCKGIIYIHVYKKKKGVPTVKWELENQFLSFLPSLSIWLDMPNNNNNSINVKIRVWAGKDWWQTWPLAIYACTKWLLMPNGKEKKCLIWLEMMDFI